MANPLRGMGRRDRARLAQALSKKKSRSYGRIIGLLFLLALLLFFLWPFLFK